MRGTTELGAGAHDACREGGFPLNQPSADRSDRVADHARSARSAVEEIGFDSPIDPEVQRDSSEVDLPRRVWVLLDAENLPANGHDYATPDEMARRALAAKARTAEPPKAARAMPTHWVGLEAAADVLGEESPEALRKKLARAAVRAADGVTEAHINGIVGRKLGKLWKVRLSAEWQGAGSAARGGRR